jgi:hypothetical protein
MATDMIYTEYPRYFVGRDEFSLRAFAYPSKGEIDFEIYRDGEYLATITSNAPHLSTSVVHRYLKGIPTPCITYVSVSGDH